MPPSEFFPLTGVWRFKIDPDQVGEKAGWTTAHFDDAAWQAVKVPHTWNVMPDHASYAGISWYRRTFDCPLQAQGAHLRLRFDAVFYQARVWLNGTYLGAHEGGYTPFEFDLSNRVRPGAENSIAVQVDNLRSNDRLPAHLYEGRSYGWNNYGGIVRDVSLILSNRTFIATQRIVAVPHLTGVGTAESAALSISITLRNASGEPFDGLVSADILDDATGQAVLSTPASTVSLTAGHTAHVSLEANLPDPRLWHFDNPNLYRCSVRLSGVNGQEIHTDKIVFGVRKVELKESHFYLNGEAVRLAGLSRHASVPGYGLAETAEVMKADFDDLKSLNMVCARPVHYPQHEFIYDYCDRHGILLSPELPAWQLTAGQMSDEHMRALARQQLAEMVAAAANHPCVWAWSVGNELESDTVAGRAYVRDMITYVKSLDPTRPVGFASYHLLVGRPWSDATIHTDFVMMNQYFGTWHGPKDSLEAALDTLHATWPEKPVIISEFGFAPHWERIEGPASIDPVQYYHIPVDASDDSHEAEEMRQCVIRDQMAIFRKKPYVAGAVFWEYRGGMGVMNERGQKRAAWQVLRQEFAPVLIQGVDISCLSESACQVQVRLRTRGPFEMDLPAYTLRNYRLQWEFVLPDGKGIYSQGEVDLPVLAPGSEWSVKVESDSPPRNAVFQARIVRPTGFTVIEWSGNCA
jgi:beta-glucuronidase